MSEGIAWVFGATGGIGAALVRALVQCDDVAIVQAGGRIAPESSDKTRPFQFDLTDEDSIAAAVEEMRQVAPDLAIVATGALAFPDGAQPKSRCAQSKRTGWPSCSC